MFVSKFWNFLLAVIIALLLVVILLVPVSVNQANIESTGSILQKDRIQLEAVLKMEARSRIDATIAFAVDPVIRKHLAMVGAFKEGEKLTGEEQDALLASMRKINESLGTLSADILFVVDLQGTVVAQIGENERTSGYSLMGFPLVDHAIRGYLMDDSWVRDGKPYRMAARPVIHQGNYIGAVVHGKRMDETLAKLLSAATGAQAAIFVDGLVTDSEAPPDPAASKGGAAPDDAGKAAPPAVHPTDNDLNKCLAESLFKDPGYADKGRSGLVLCEGPGEKGSKFQYYASAVKFVGEARHNDAGVVITRTVPLKINLKQFLTAPERKAEIKSQKMMLSVVGALMIVLAAIGFVIVFFEGDRPKKRFLKEVETMASREGERLNIYLFRGRYRKIADAVNRAIDGAVQVLVSKATADAPTVDKILGPKGVEPRLSKPKFEIPEQISLDDIAPPPPGGAAKPGQAPAPAYQAAPEPPSQQPSIPTAQGRPAPPARSPLPHPAQKPGGLPPPMKAAPAAPAAPAGGRTPVPQAAAVLAQVPPVEAPAAEDDETRYRRIYKEFFDLKTSCGESTEGLTYERFRATLKKQEDAIRERTVCRGVDFRVYVKEGKAALKATPIK